MFPRRIVSSYLVACTAFGMLCSHHAPAATTTPLGIYAVKINGTAPGESRARTYLGIQLLQPPVVLGLASQVDGKRFSYSFSGLPSLESGKEYFVHVLNGPGSGFITRVVSFEGSWIVCDQNLMMTPGAQVSIRPHPRLIDLFGADNRFGFAAAPNAATADKIVIWDAAIQQERVYYYNSTRSRWEEKDVEAEAGLTNVRYPNGLYVVRHSATPLRIALKGEISAAPVLLPVHEGGNVFSLPVNLSASLANLVASDGSFHVQSGKNAAQADILSFVDPGGVARRGPFYFRSKPGDTGWRTVGADDSDEPLQPLDMLSTLVLHGRGGDHFLRVTGSLDAPASPPFVPDSDPEVGELPLQVEMKMPVQQMPGLFFTLEVSRDLQQWAAYGAFAWAPGGYVSFQLPPGESRAFYRMRVESEF
ncbi:hypothetical protein [Haloferula sp. BvORR071]|uniref:hypothetical protein n=1 Tax=Haloferula sp. BvORR071 TaxID=1396141 RepID=UPI00054FBCE8|nr:hypothetical protein [Haloferula sp. BvORR071]